VRDRFMILPEITAKDGDAGRLAFGLPTGGE